MSRNFMIPWPVSRPRQSHQLPNRPILVLATGITALLLALPGMVSASALSKSWNLRELTEFALQNNPGIKAARYELEASEGLLQQAQNRPNPELSVSQEDSNPQYRSQTLQLTLPLETAGKRPARIRLAEARLQSARINLLRQQAELKADIAAAYSDCLIARSRAELENDSRQLAALATDVAVKRVAAGKLSPVEVSKAKVAEATFKVDLLQAESQRRQTQFHLISLLGMQLTSRDALELQDHFNETLPPLPPVAQLLESLQQAPAVMLAQQEIEQRLAALRLEKSKRVPDLALSIGMKRAAELQRDQWIVGITLPLPVFDRNQGNLLDAARQVDKAREELHALVQRYSADLLTASDKLAAIRAEMTLLEQQVIPEASSAYQAARLGFEHGKFSFLEVLDAQRVYFSVRSQYLQSLSVAYATTAEIQRMTGTNSLTQALKGE